MKRKAELKEIQMTVLSKSVDSAHEQKSNTNTTAEQPQSFLGSLFHPHARANKKQSSWKDKYRRTYLQILKVIIFGIMDPTLVPLKFKRD
jgi:hypothetical protein